MLLSIAVVLVAGSWFVFSHGRGDTSKNTKGDTAKQQKITFNTKQHSLEDPASIWIIVNKHRPLIPSDYTPTDLVAPNMPLRLDANNPEMQLRHEAATALKTMHDAAQAQGWKLQVSSAYRSYDYQKSLYASYVRQQGQAAADSQSARAGYSEHQTGLAVDIEPTSGECEVDPCFADLPEGKWVAAHAYEYGFVVRYPKGKQKITGYIYEPWHLRYVGKALAAELHKQSSPTLEEFFGLGAAPDYP